MPAQLPPSKRTGDPSPARIAVARRRAEEPAARRPSPAPLAREELPLSAVLARSVRMRARPTARTLARTTAQARSELAAATTPEARATALRTFDDADVLEAVRGLSQDERTALDAAVRASAADKDKLIHRAISFANAVREADWHTPATVTAAGTLTDERAAGAGRVAVRTGATFQRPGVADPNAPPGTVAAPTTHAGAFSMSYTGDDAGSARWLQFIWREIVEDVPWRLKERVAGMTGTVATGRYRLTTDPDMPAYNVDAGAHSAFYDDSGAGIRTATTAAMLDAPSANAGLVWPRFTGEHPAQRVYSRAHFVTYLVVGMNVLYQVKTTVEWSFGRADYATRQIPAPTLKTTSKGKVAALEARQRAVLLGRFPGLDYLA